jgi:hypothetical protein
MEHGFALWTIVLREVHCYGPLCRIWLCKKIYIFRTRGPRSGFGSELWGTAKELVRRYGHRAGFFLCYGPLRSVWLCPLGHSAKCGLVEWAIAQDMVLHALGPKSKNWFGAMGNSAKYNYL